MTVLVPRSPAPPSVRSRGQWAIALAQSLSGTALGLLIFLISFGTLLTEFSDQPPPALVGMYLLDALIGVPATLLLGPLRFLPPGRLHTAAHLLLAAAVGLSTWAMPAAALALYRIGVRRRTVLDAAADRPRFSPDVLSRLVRLASDGAPVAGGAGPGGADGPSSAPGVAEPVVPEGVTGREWEVARLVAVGLANQEIGERLFMSIATVKTHLGRLYHKLQVSNRVQLAIRVLELGG